MNYHRIEKSIAGFTLIELLVVISIIGLLSSVVVASLNTAREKARINAAAQFASQVGRLAGDAAVGIWDFDECSGTTAFDRSGFDNHGEFTNSPVWEMSNTPSGRGCSIDFSGAVRYIDVPNSSSLSLSTNFTVSLWVYLKSQTSSVFLIKGDGTVNGAAPSYGFNANGFMFIAYNSSNSPYVARTAVDINRWHHFVGVVSGNSRHMYIDGKLVASSSSGNHPWSNTNVLRIGASQNSYGSNAILDEVRVYAKTLTASEVGRLYAESAGQFKIANAVE